MVKYNPDVPLTDYKAFLVELERDYKRTKILSVLSKVVIVVILIAVLITLELIVPSSASLSRWMYIPIIIVVLFITSSFKITVKNKDNAFSNFLNADYKSILRDIRHDIKTVSYYIDCIEKGIIPDSVYAYISAE